MTSPLLVLLQQQREVKGLSRAEVGAMIGVSRVAVYNYETGRVDPPLHRVVEYAQALGLDLEVAGFGSAPDEWDRPVEASVRRDLHDLGTLDGMRGTLASMALRMARAYDRHDGGDLAKMARLNLELRQTLAAIKGADDVGDDDGDVDMPAPGGDSPLA